MEYSSIFERTEMKYLLSTKQYLAVKQAISKWMEIDKYGRTTICNLYYDTFDSILIQRSLEKPLYKEKLRVRSYGQAGIQSPAFVELKKKYKGIVYKRRVAMPYSDAISYMNGHEAPMSNQIISEIDYFKSFYRNLRPMMYISYEREAFFCKSSADLRITFDQNILYRDTDLSLCSRPYGSSLLEEEQVLMEIKASMAIPLWLVSILNTNHLTKTSFSKYGNAYLSSIAKGVYKYA